MAEQGVVFKTHIGSLAYLNNMSYLEIPKAVVDDLGGKLKVRLICTVNENLSFQCGLMALGEGKAYISLNAKRMKQLNVRTGDHVTVELRLDESAYGLEVPEELSELLSQDDEGNRRFEMLTPGKKRYIIFYISSVKASQLRVERAIRLMENLKRTPEGKEEFRIILGH